MQNYSMKKAMNASYGAKVFKLKTGCVKIDTNLVKADTLHPHKTENKLINKLINNFIISNNLINLQKSNSS